MNKLKLFILDLFFPNRCPICNNFIVYDSFICDDCICKLEKYIVNNDAVYKENPLYTRLTVYYYYEGIVKNGIYSLKDNSKNFGVYLGKMLADKILLDDIMNKADYIVPVPMSKKSFKNRGYNQAFVIAKEISDKTGIKLLDNIIFKKESLVQHELSLEERKKNVLAFYSKNNMDLSGKKIIICDDVITTGCTVNRCAELLLNMNVAEVYAAVGTINK